MMYTTNKFLSGKRFVLIWIISNAQVTTQLGARDQQTQQTIRLLASANLRLSRV